MRFFITISLLLPLTGSNLACETSESSTAPSCDDAPCPPDEVICDPARPHEGCPCSDGDVAPCYDGDPVLIGVGTCREGLRRCVGQRYGACQNQLLPTDELCDGLDQDCDGAADNGLGAACLPCEDSCTRAGFGVGSGGAPFAPGPGAEGVRDDNGVLLLDAETVDVSFVWIANSEEGTVSKLRSSSGEEVGRYLSAEALEGLPPPLERCNEIARLGNCPSRSAVDLRGDVWVANRAFGGQGSVTKIAAAGCPDRNGDGVVTSSFDADGNGMIDIEDPEEFPGLDDECLLFTVKVGQPGGVPRALAVDPFSPDTHGSVWVGAYEEKKLYQFHGSSGEPLKTVELPIHPYGAVMARDGRLWVTSTKGNTFGGATLDEQAIISVDSSSGELGFRVPIETSTACAGGYGIALDGAGRIWLGGWSCEAAFRYDPARLSWMTVNLGGKGYARGIAVDGQGYVWLAHSHSRPPNTSLLARVTRFRAEDGGDRQVFELPDAAETIGMGIDSEERVWAINKSSDNASRIDPRSGEILTVQVGAGPYTYSDFTGYGLRTFTAPFGRWAGTVDACPPMGDPLWETLAWGADSPPGTQVTLWLRVGHSEEALDFVPRHGPFLESPVDLGATELPRLRFLRIEVELRTDDPEISPRVQAVQVQYHCPAG